MFLSYNHVPFTEKYKSINNIEDDLSNAYLCYDNHNDNVFKNVTQDKIIYRDIDDVLVMGNISNKDIKTIVSFYSQLPCPLLYNNLQDKYQVYFVFNREEKNQLSNNLQNLMYACKYYEMNIGLNNIIHSYISFGSNIEEYKKFWNLNVTLPEINL